MSWCSYHAVCRDNPEVDVFGSNLYNKFIKECLQNENCDFPKECLQNENCDFPHTSRQIPEDFDFNPQTALRCNSVLVGTGVYDPKIGNCVCYELLLQLLVSVGVAIQYKKRTHSCHVQCSSTVYLPQCHNFYIYNFKS